MLAMARFGTSVAMRSRVALAIMFSFCLDLPAYAHGEAGAQLPEDAPAVTKDGEKAKAELARVSAAQVAKDGASKEAAPKDLLSEPLAKGNNAIARAHGASLAGDETGAKLLSRVALAWAQAAAATLRAFETEKGAEVAEVKTTGQKDQIQRKKALLVEMEARKLSLTKEVAAAEADVKSPAKVSGDAPKKNSGETKPQKNGSSKQVEPKK